jgi:hypothetical protein
LWTANGGGTAKAQVIEAVPISRIQGSTYRNGDPIFRESSPSSTLHKETTALSAPGSQNADGIIRAWQAANRTRKILAAFSAETWGSVQLQHVCSIAAAVFFRDGRFLAGDNAQ